MRVDIVHMRDPDCECDIEVYIDGEKVDFHRWEFDPGVGYTAEEFEEMRRDAVDAAPDFLKARLDEAYDDMEAAYDKWAWPL